MDVDTDSSASVYIRYCLSGPEAEARIIISREGTDYLSPIYVRFSAGQWIPVEIINKPTGLEIYLAGVLIYSEQSMPYEFDVISLGMSYADSPYTTFPGVVYFDDVAVYDIG